MPTHVLPRRNTLHRVAAVALYRTLLLQSRSLPATREQRDALQNIIRNRFKQAQHVQSPRLLKISFEAGYEAIDHLDAAAGGNDESRSYVLDLLDRSPARVKQPKPAPLNPHKRKAMNTEGHAKEGAVERPRINLFDRPLPLEKLSGKRHVPVLFSANSIPILRLKKPQPESLSRYIRQRIEQRQAWHDRRQRLMEELFFAREEDRWDRLTSRKVRNLERAMSGIENSMEPRWEDAIRESMAHVDSKLTAEGEKYRVMAQKMQAVVDQEQALYDQEKQARQEAREAEKFATQQESIEQDHNRGTLWERSLLPSK